MNSAWARRFAGSWKEHFATIGTATDGFRIDPVKANYKKKRVSLHSSSVRVESDVVVMIIQCACSGSFRVRT